MKTHCEKCGSSDGVEVYEDHEFCFVCRTYNPNKELTETTKEDNYVGDTVNSISQFKTFALGDRGISFDVVDYFNVRCSVDVDGRQDSHYYPYTKEGQTVAYKQRKLPKTFSIIGDFKDVELFGQSLFSGGRTLVVCEGEIDTLSVAEAFKQYKGRIYPCVGLPSASSTNSILVNRDYLKSFDEVILMLDQDEAGQTAINPIAKMLPAGRVKVAKLPEKDANETLRKHGHMTILHAVWNARVWSPAGIVVGEQVWDQFVARQETESIPYPECLHGLNDKLGGMRLGEITLFTSGTGSGKSTVIKEIILDLLDKTDSKVGLISLEESVGDTAEKFINMALRRNINDPPPASEKETRAGFEIVFGDSRLVLLDHQGSVGDDSLIDKIEYMALMGCHYLVLDHITIAVSEGSEGLSGNEAIDKIMSDLLKVVKRHNVWLGLISHLRKTAGGKPFEEGTLAGLDDIKGSGSIKQISFDIIAFARNLVAEDDIERNTVKFRVLKSRFTGRTGPAGSAVYDPKTTRLSSKIDIDFEGL